MESKEFKMFDAKKVKPNLKAYEQGQEWIKIFKSILANKKTSSSGNFFQCKRAQSNHYFIRVDNPKFFQQLFSPPGRVLH